MEENKKVNLEEVEAKENDCKLTDKELEKAAGGTPAMTMGAKKREKA